MKAANGLHAETAVGFLENTKWLLKLKDSRAEEISHANYIYVGLYLKPVSKTIWQMREMLKKKL